MGHPPVCAKTSRQLQMQQTATSCRAPSKTQPTCILAFSLLGLAAPVWPCKLIQRGKYQQQGVARDRTQPCKALVHVETVHSTQRRDTDRQHSSKMYMQPQQLHLTTPLTAHRPKSGTAAAVTITPALPLDKNGPQGRGRQASLTHLQDDLSRCTMPLQTAPVNHTFSPSSP